MNKKIILFGTISLICFFGFINGKSEINKKHNFNCYVKQVNMVINSDDSSIYNNDKSIFIIKNIVYKKDSTPKQIYKLPKIAEGCKYYYKGFSKKNKHLIFNERCDDQYSKYILCTSNLQDHYSLLNFPIFNNTDSAFFVFPNSCSLFIECPKLFQIWEKYNSKYNKIYENKFGNDIILNAKWVNDSCISVQYVSFIKFSEFNNKVPSKYVKVKLLNKKQGLWR